MQLRNAGDGPNAGYFYVCGSASTLAKDVTNVLGDLLSILTFKWFVAIAWWLLDGSPPLVSVVAFGKVKTAMR